MTTSSVPVLVAGASGFVGSHTARLLVQRGRKVRVLLRKTSNTEALNNIDVEIVHGDVLDPASLRAAMEGCGSVFYSVVDPRFWLTDVTPIYRNNVEGLVNAMDAALAAGIEHFIFTSSMGTLGFNPNGPVTEDIPFNWHDRASAYIRARLEAENQFLKYCREKNLPGVALCVANTYGPEDYQPTPHGKMLWDVAKGRVRFALDAGAPTVDIRDVAEAALLAEQHGRAGERYIIANEYIHNRDFYGLAAAQGGHKPLKIIPYRVASILANTAERIFKLLGKKDYLLSNDAVFLSDAFRQMDNSKARKELHWNPRPIAETVRDAVAWYGTEGNALNDLEAIKDIEALKQLKARYCRFLDTKDWVAWREIFTDDFASDTTESGGKIIVGPDEFIAFVRKNLGSPRRTTVHQVHAPEIELTSETTARGIWALEDFVRFAPGLNLRGYGHYHETYQKSGGQWRIQSSKLTRLRGDIVTPILSVFISRWSKKRIVESDRHQNG